MTKFTDLLISFNKRFYMDNIITSNVLDPVLEFKSKKHLIYLNFIYL